MPDRQPMPVLLSKWHEYRIPYGPGRFGWPFVMAATISAILAPRVSFDGRAAFVDNDPLGDRARVDPQHLHGALGFIDEIMDPTAGLQRSLTVAHGIPSPLDDTGRRS